MPGMSCPHAGPAAEAAAREGLARRGSNEREWTAVSLRFILGVAGAGKTTRCLAEIQRRLREAPLGPCLLLLVPEQASFQAETALLGAAGIEGTFRAQVLSFHRLAWRVLQEAGGAGRIHLSEVGRHMVLRAAVEKRLDDLRVFRPAAQRPNFAAAVADMLQEMQAYGVTPEDLEVRAAELGKAEGRELLGAKLGELSLLWREYASLLEGRCLAPTDYLHLLARRIPHARFLAGGEVWVDGFNGFTPQEYDVLQVLLQVSRRLTVALCLDPDLEGRQPDPDALFARTHATYWRLVELAEGAGVPVEKSMVLGKSTPPRFAASPPLQHLERALRQYPRPSYQGEVREVRLVAAPSCRAEVEAAAREMIRLARDEGYRWRDMAVLVREMEPYQRLLELVLEEYDIPCFIDCKRPVTDHPLVVLLCAALEVVSSGWAYEAVMRYLKTDLVPVGREEVDALENYLLAHGIRGSRWYDEHPWTYRLGERAGRAVPSRGEEGFIADLNRLRQQIAAPLRRLQEALQADPSVRGACAALVRLMEELGVEDTLRAWVESAVAEGSLEEAQQHAQVHAQVLEVLDEMVQALGEQSPGAERFLQTLEAGFHALRLGVVPPGLDQVFAGSLDRSRNPEVKACFVLGANEGVFPARAAGGGVLSEGER
ncbi:MAG: helicase-exonuclease AddAB subunit AddB, partial [Syntrophomonadaceae bacterium]|nr:helicase-exonuclease AddAB subunit AddB [Syntrophomonadaceae bacterium]